MALLVIGTLLGARIYLRHTKIGNCCLGVKATFRNLTAVAWQVIRNDANVAFFFREDFCAKVVQTLTKL